MVQVSMHWDKYPNHSYPIPRKTTFYVVFSLLSCLFNMYIRSSLHAFELFKKRIKNLQVEEFWVLALSSQLKCLGLKAIARGTVDYCHIHPRDVFLYTIKCNATQILIAHNHTNEDPHPSSEDLEVTELLLKAAKILKIPIIDHLVMTPDKYTSFADQNWFNISV